MGEDVRNVGVARCAEADLPAKHRAEPGRSRDHGCLPGYWGGRVREQKKLGSWLPRQISAGCQLARAGQPRRELFSSPSWTLCWKARRSRKLQKTAWAAPNSQLLPTIWVPRRDGHRASGATRTGQQQRYADAPLSGRRGGADAANGDAAQEPAKPARQGRDRRRGPNNSRNCLASRAKHVAGSQPQPASQPSQPTHTANSYVPSGRKPCRPAALRQGEQRGPPHSAHGALALRVVLFHGPGKSCGVGCLGSAPAAGQSARRRRVCAGLAKRTAARARAISAPQEKARAANQRRRSAATHPCRPCLCRPGVPAPPTHDPRPTPRSAAVSHTDRSPPPFHPSPARQVSFARAAYLPARQRRRVRRRRGNC